MTEAEFLAGDDAAAMLPFSTGHTDVADGPNSMRRPSDRRLRLFACGVCRLAWPSLTDPRGRAAVEVAERYADGMATAREMADAGDEADAPDAEHGRFATPFWAAQATTLGGARDAANVAVDYGGVPPAACAAMLRCVLGNPFRPASLCGLPYCAGSAAPGESCGGCRRLREAPDVLALARAAYDTPRPCPRCGGAGEVKLTEMRHLGGHWEQMVLGYGACPACHGGRTDGLLGVDGLLDPVRLAVLADALTDAGCTNEALLGHLRGLEPCPACGGSGCLAPYARCGFCRDTGRRPAGPHARGCWALDCVLGRE